VAAQALRAEVFEPSIDGAVVGASPAGKTRSNFSLKLTISIPASW
jgi:hypothetical protein